MNEIINQVGKEHGSNCRKRGLAQITYGEVKLCWVYGRLSVARKPQHRTRMMAETCPATGLRDGGARRGRQAGRPVE